MAKRISIRRLLLALLATAFCVATVTLVMRYRRLDRQFYEWMAARPASFRVDLSKPGTYSGPLHQTCSISHGEAIYLSVKSLPPRRLDGDNLLDGLAATIAIVGPNGKEVINQEIAPPFEQERDGICLAHVRPFPTGSYVARVTVSRGAIALRGIEQTMSVAYVLCGLERIPAQITGLLAAVCAIPTVVLVSFAAARFLKFGVWARPPSK